MYRYMYMNAALQIHNKVSASFYLFGDVSGAGDDDLRHAPDLEVNGAHSEVLLNQWRRRGAAADLSLVLLAFLLAFATATGTAVATGVVASRELTAHSTEAVELGDVEFTVAVVVSQPELLLAVGFLADAFVSPQRADSIVLGAERHVGEVLAVLEVEAVLEVVFRTVIACAWNATSIITPTFGEVSSYITQEIV